ncbi:pyrroline-5-carboxylate reductase [Campylobacterota bacterium]|nr:pyrroline-5-carboxylate reductase [Campylobacterota bacterium]
MKILLIGAGNMGGALYAAWHAKHDIAVVEKNEHQRERLRGQFADAVFADAIFAESGEAYADHADRVAVLAIKPQSLSAFKLPKVAAIVSIMAGVTLAVLREKFQAAHYIRAMPNLAALYGKSATTLTGSESFKNEALELFGAIGLALWVESEKEIGIATALAGSGPGFLALAAEAMANAAVKLGMKAVDSHALTAALFSGTGELLAREHPALLKERVSSPGGTTAAGLGALEAHNARNAFMQAIEAAYKRSGELG